MKLDLILHSVACFKEVMVEILCSNFSFKLLESRKYLVASSYFFKVFKKIPISKQREEATPNSFSLMYT
jgi:hypothetical protein